MSSVVAIAAALLVTPLAQAADRPRLALAVSPARIAVTGHASRRIVVRNIGVDRVVVDVGRRAVGWRTAARNWLQVAPANAVLSPGARVGFTLRMRPPPRAEPGNHQALVMLTTRPPREARVGVRMRVGVRVHVHVPGRIVHRLALRSFHVSARRGVTTLLVSVANRGNVTVQPRRSVALWLERRRRVVARLRPRGPARLRPGTRVVLAFPYRGRARGPVTAVVRLRPGGSARPVTKRFRLRL